MSKDWPGRIVQTIIETDIEEHSYETVVDVTDRIKKLQSLFDKQETQLAAVQREIADIKNRRYWEEIELFTDKITGMSVAMRTTYRWQAEVMRLEFTPDMYDVQSFPKAPRDRQTNAKLTD